MVEVFRQMAAGNFDLSREVTLERPDRDDGWGDLVYAPLGNRYTVANLLRLMKSCTRAYRARHACSIRGAIR